MPPKQVHATHTLLTFGRTWFDLHDEKDAPSRYLGRMHRTVNHDWYQAGLAGAWTLDEPFPDWIHRINERIAAESGGRDAEEYQVWLSHDLADRIWDELDGTARREHEAFCCWLVMNPAYLLDLGQVDVISGRIHRLIDGEDVWEVEPDLVSEYVRLRRYVEAVLKRDPSLRALVWRLDQRISHW